MIESLVSIRKLRRATVMALSTALALALALSSPADLITDTQSVAAQAPPTVTPGKATPATATAPLCHDSYEDDGVPSQAKPLVVGEAQTRTFCPVHDADWVTFFAKSGKGYSI